MNFLEKRNLINVVYIIKRSIPTMTVVVMRVGMNMNMNSMMGRNVVIIITMINHDYVIYL